MSIKSAVRSAFVMPLGPMEADLCLTWLSGTWNTDTCSLHLLCNEKFGRRIVLSKAKPARKIQDKTSHLKDRHIGLALELAHASGTTTRFYAFYLEVLLRDLLPQLRPHPSKC